ncbi:MAG: hypothetical protein IPJ30_08910 [Acidobacteria bacterium]|nr:hypothetical protein [Acidobacteriota bacterium]
MKNSLLLVLVILTAATIGFAQNRSVYTSLEAKDCKTLEQEDEGAGWYRGECKGVAGFKLEVTEGDLRQSVNVVMPSVRFTNSHSVRSRPAFRASARKPNGE